MLSFIFTLTRFIKTIIIKLVTASARLPKNQSSDIPMSIQERTLALAGTFQAAELVRQIARQGMVDQAPFESSINSVLALDADNVEAVYGQLSNIKLGLQILCVQFQNNADRKRDVELTRYVLGLMSLERKLRKNKAMLQDIREQLIDICKLTENYPSTHPEVITALANLYSNTLSTFDFRIHVSGEPRFLQNQHNADRVRALLLAGIRSMVLWQQKKGHWWHFIFSRRKMLKVAKQFLEQIQTNEHLVQSIQ